MKFEMKQIIALALGLGTTVASSAQCTADFDFGTSLYGASPDATIGEQFDAAFLNEFYEDVFHVLVPVDASAIDPAFTLPLDSIILTTATLTDPNTGSSFSFSDVGLEIVCNNNGVSSNPCTFHGGGQYCAVLTGTPNQIGVFDMTLDVQAYVTVFGIPIPQPYSFSGYVLTIEDNGAVIGVTELDSELPSVALFPNPSEEWVSVSTAHAERLAVRDLTGRVVYETLLGENQSHRFQVLGWSRGVYVVAVEGLGGVQCSQLVVQ